MKTIKQFLFCSVKCLLILILLFFSGFANGDSESKNSRLKMKGRFYDCGTPGVWMNIQFNWKKKPSGSEQIYLRPAGKQSGTALRFFADRIQVMSVKKGVVKECRSVKQAVSAATPLLIKLRKEALFLYAGMDRAAECKRNSKQKEEWGMNAAAASSIKNVRISRKRERLIFTDDFMRQSVSVNTQWDMDTEVFAISSPRYARKKINPFLLHASGSRSGSCLTGSTKWDAYRIGVSLRFLDEQSCAGILFSHQDKKNYCIAKWGSILQLIKVVNGKKRILAEKALPFKTAQWYRLEAAADDYCIELFVDSVCVLKAKNGIPGGRVGVFHGCGSVEFDDFTVCEKSEDGGFRKGVGAVNSFFRNDKYMKKWADVEFDDTGNPYYDDVFLNQPVNWIFQQGAWDTRPRWICDRKYSFLGAACQKKAMITWKQKIRGDFVVDIFAATPMKKRRSPFYDYPLNIQCQVHGSGTDLSTGYGFVFGRFDLPSCILRNGKVLASSRAWTKKDFRKGKTPQYHRLHQEWVHMQCSRENGILKLTVDDTVLVHVKDDQPLGSGWLSIFTSENGLALARVRIQAEEFLDRISPLSHIYTKQIPDQDFKLGLIGLEEKRAQPIPENAAPVFKGTLNNEKTAWQSDFQKGAPAWMEMQGAEGGRLTIEGEKEERFLRVINTAFGGMNGVFLFRGLLRTGNDTTVEFRYRMMPGVHLNLILVDRDFVCREISFTDPVQHMFPCAGVCEGIIADNTWRRACTRLGDYTLNGLGDICAIFLGDPEFCSSYTGMYYDLDDVKITHARKIELASAQTTSIQKKPQDSVLLYEGFDSDFKIPESWRGGSFIPIARNEETCLFLFPRYDPHGNHWPNSVDIRPKSTDLKQHDHLCLRCMALENDLNLHCYVIRNEEKISLHRITVSCDGKWHTVDMDLLSAFDEKKKDHNRVVTHIILDAGKQKYLLDELTIYSAKEMHAEKTKAEE